jgi:hypothetical protein
MQAQLPLVSREESEGEIALENAAGSHLGVGHANKASALGQGKKVKRGEVGNQVGKI